jgi:erythromycin esterase-like protein
MINAIEPLGTRLKTHSDALPIIEEAAGKQCVMLGEASHGTAEYYNWRIELSKQLIRDEAFSFIAVEGDWPDCFRLNSYVKGYDYQDLSPQELLKGSFARWPTWMWANEEVASFISWLRDFNAEQPDNQKVGIYGLDVYSLWQSLYSVVGYLKEHAPDQVEKAYQAFACFEPYKEDIEEYARAAALVPTSCEDEVVELLQHILQGQKTPLVGDSEAKFNAMQNAYALKGAEQYYRNMVYGGSTTWNIRDHHMMETLQRLFRYYGKQAKGIVWAHNTHIGDARFTDMNEEGMVNLGQLGRQQLGEGNVMLVGFGSYEGKVIAGRAWDEPYQTMTIPQAVDGSWEHLLHETGKGDQFILFKGLHISVPGALYVPINQRAIGVVYHPEFEAGNYVPSVIPQRYDAFCYFETTSALHPLTVSTTDTEEVPETYPSAL